jgi:cystathionine gamma-synthase/methionine-gamma-lyase
MTDLETVAQVVEQVGPSVVLVETISNPLLRVADIPALIDLTHSVGGKLVVDNTFATPCLYRPVLSGADFVVESATKYLGGHGDAMGGLVAASAEDCHTARELQKVAGGILGPNEAWLILRGMKTLVLRMRQHCHNAFVVAGFLSSHPRVNIVYYPGLPGYAQFPLARRLFPSNQHGGMVSFEIKGAGQAEIFRFMDALRLIIPATSLGDVYSLMLCPAHSSHRSLSDEQRQRLLITPGLVRLSVGIEEASDIVADLDQALSSVG